MLDHPACFADSVLNADTSGHEYEGNTWVPNGVDKIDTPAGGCHNIVMQRVEIRLTDAPRPLWPPSSASTRTMRTRAGSGARWASRSI